MWDLFALPAGWRGHNDGEVSIPDEGVPGQPLPLEESFDMLFRSCPGHAFFCHNRLSPKLELNETGEGSEGEGGRNGRESVGGRIAR